MDPHSFADHLSAWIDPSVVLQVVRAHGTPARHRLDEPGFVLLNGSEPGAPRATGLDILVEKLLRGFRLPSEYVALLALRFPDVLQESVPHRSEADSMRDAEGRAGASR